MSCARCDAPTLSVTVPEHLLEPAPGEAIDVCTTCLTVEAAADGAANPDFDRISEAVPDGDAGVATLLLAGLLESLATNRAAIETVVEALEADGTDPMLVLDELATDPGLEPAVDIGRRSHQLEQLVL